MPQIVVTVLVGIASLVAFIGLVRGINSARRAGEWNPSATYFLLVPAIYFTPMAVGQLTGAVTLQFDVFYNHVTVMEPWLLNLQRVTVAMLTALGGITFVRFGVLQRNPINPVAFALIFVVLTAGISDAINGLGGVLDTRQIGLISLLMGASVLPRGRGVQIGSATFAVGLGVASSLMTFLNTPLAYRECRVDKCGVLGTLLLGATTGENILGLTLMTAIPFAWLGFRGKVRVLLTSYLAFMVIATGSRTALYGTVIVLAIIMITRFSMDAPSRWRLSLAGLVFIGTTAATALFPLQDLASNDFSLRGVLWQVSKENIAAHPWLGLGQDGWINLYTTQVLTGTPSAGPHNFVLLILHEGGVVGLAFAILALVGMLRAGGRNYRVAAMLVLAPILSSGILEQPWEMATLAWSTCGVIAAMAALPARPSKDELATIPVIVDRPAARRPAKELKAKPYPSFPAHRLRVRR